MDWWTLQTQDGRWLSKAPAIRGNPWTADAAQARRMSEHEAKMEADIWEASGVRGIRAVPAPHTED